MYDIKSVKIAMPIIAKHYAPKYNVPLEILADFFIDKMCDEEDGHKGEFKHDFGDSPFENGVLNGVVFEKWLDNHIEKNGISCFEKEEEFLKDNI